MQIRGGCERHCITAFSISLGVAHHAEHVGQRRHAFAEGFYSLGIIEKNRRHFARRNVALCLVLGTTRASRLTRDRDERRRRVAGGGSGSRTRTGDFSVMSAVFCQLNYPAIVGARPYGAGEPCGFAALLHGAPA